MTKLGHYFGTDPEVFISDGLVRIDGIEEKLSNIIPPAQLEEDGIKFEQDRDKKILIKDDGYQWSEDGAAIEAQIIPSNSVNTFYQLFLNSLDGLNNFLKGLNLTSRHDVLGYFDVDKYWKAKDERFRMCVIFGCDPDMSPGLYVETGLENKVSDEEVDVSTHTFRYGGGHIHIQAGEENPYIYFDEWDMAAILFDFFIGLKNTTFSRPPEIKIQELKRLEHYGKPGRVRLQEYPNEKFGIEYRVLSNFWLRSKETVRGILNCADIAATIVERNLARTFINDFNNIIPNVYNAIVTLDGDTGYDILNDVINWSKNKELVNNEKAENAVR